MISRGLVLSLGTTSLVSVLLFLYFRNRVSSVEHKVSMLFKLIEDHHQQQQVQFMEKMAPPNNLINVSDDESDSDESTEYETDSDNGKLSIHNENVKTIELNHTFQPQEEKEYDGDDEKNTFEEQSSQIKKDVQEDFTIFKIKELKKMCGERGLTKYSHLNKAALVNLLKQS